MDKTTPVDAPARAPHGDEASPPAASEAPVRIVARKPGTENRMWRVWLDTIEAADGTVVHDYVVVEPKSVSPSGHAGVAVIPVDASGAVLLLRNWRHALPGYFWEAAKGFIDAGETAETAALRELTEETGCVCPPGRLVPLGTLAQEPSTLKARVALFAALDCRRQPRPDHQEPGLGTPHAFPPAEAFRMAAEGTIEDAVTVVALLRLQAKGHLER